MGKPLWDMLKNLDFPVANGASSDDRAGIRNIDVCRLKGKWLFVPEIAICTCLGFSGYC